MNNKLTDFNEINDALKELTEKLNGIPTVEEIEKDGRFPWIKKLRKIYRENTGISYIQYLKQIGYNDKRVNEFTYDDLICVWEDYYEKNGKYPKINDCRVENGLPSWSKVMRICGDKLEEFKLKYNVIIPPKKENFEDYCISIIELSKKLGKTPTTKEIRELADNIPDYRWLIRNCPDANVTNYNELMLYIGLKPHYLINKEMATTMILNKYKRLSRNLKKDDFDNPKYDEIGISTIDRIWGSFNNMLIDLGLPINQVSMLELSKSTTELEDDIKRLCEHVYNKNGNKLITLDDLKECDWCQSYGTYNRRFKKEFNMSLREYIESIGFELNKAGMGMVYTFQNGEITTSKYEYEVSNYLRANNIKYLRNIKYENFTYDYTGNKDCDYVITINNITWYIEIAGILRDVKSMEHSKTIKLPKIQRKYLNDLIEKESMLKQANVNYKILFPNDLKNLDEAFSFLHYPKLAN